MAFDEPSLFMGASVGTIATTAIIVLVLVLYRITKS
jgi:hypothetical protein